jgi:AraC-like DNA-binding protein
MRKNRQVIFNPWLLSPDTEKTYYSKYTTISLGEPNDNLPPIMDEINWVSKYDQRLPIHVQQVGTSSWCPGTCIERKVSNILSIELVTNGCGELIVDGKKNDIQKNDVFILHPDEHHIYRALPPERFSRHVVFLTGRNSMHLIKQTELDTVSHIRLSPQKAKYVLEIFENINLTNRMKQDGFIRTASSETYKLILLLSDEVYGQCNLPDLPDNLVDAMEYVYNNLEKKIHPDHMAQAAHCSTGNLARLFKEHLNTTPYYWAECQKIIYATKILANSRKKIYEIAEELSYCDQFHFTKVFKRFIGMSPTTFRQQWRRKNRNR